MGFLEEGYSIYNACLGLKRLMVLLIPATP